MVSDERSPISPPILRLSKYWIEAHVGLHSGPVPAFLAYGNRSHFYMPRWTECGWMEIVTLYHDSIHFTRTHLICANLSTEWSRFSLFDRQQSGRRGQLRLRCRQSLFSICVSLVSRIGQRLGVQTSLPQR